MYLTLWWGQRAAGPRNPQQLPLSSLALLSYFPEFIMGHVTLLRALSL